MKPERIVYFVGAGPGDPGLITRRGVECLAEADVVLHDRQVSPRLLDLAPAQAERICVAQLARLPTDRRRVLRDVLLEQAGRVGCLVRLVNGDPFLFGRTGEEASWLSQAGIAHEVVPGVSAGPAAAAYTDVPLSHWSHPSGVALLSGFDDPERSATTIDWPALARFPGSLVFYKGLARLREASEMLIQHGMDPNTPAMAVQSATTGDQRTVASSLQALHEDVLAAGLTGPAVVLVGPIIAARQWPSWFESKPLFGKRVLIARAREQAEETARRLDLLGALPIILPAISVRAPEDWSDVDACLARLLEYAWLVFTSANGVLWFLDRLLETGRDLRALGSVKLAAIGPGTAAALETYHLKADLVPKAYRAEELANELSERARGQKVLLARADRGRDVLPEQLREHVAEIRTVVVYRQEDAVNANSEVLDGWRRGEIDFVLATSSNIARALLGALDEVCRQRVHAGDVQIVSISPVTSAAIQELALPVAAEARSYTIDGVITALVELAAKS